MNIEQKLEELKKRDRMAAEGGGSARRERQHKEGKMSARERIEFLLDEGTFEETDKLVTHRSHRLRHGRAEVITATALSPAMDASKGGWCLSSRRISPCSADRCRKPTPPRSCKIMDLAMKMGAPVIGLNDSGGARIQEGVMSLAGYADIFLRNTLAQRSGAADFSHHGAVRGRRGVFAGHHRFYPDGG